MNNNKSVLYWEYLKLDKLLSLQSGIDGENEVKNNPAANIQAPKSGRKLPSTLDVDSIVRLIEIKGDEIETVRGLQDFSHLWISFIFHLHVGKGWSATVKPPRLNGKQKFGVFATRASFRPNPIGLSLVEIDRIEQKGAQLFIHIKGADLLDKTPSKLLLEIFGTFHAKKVITPAWRLFIVILISSKYCGNASSVDFVLNHAR